MDHFFRSIISGQRAGAFAAILRGVFAVASGVYTGVINGRNVLYDRGVIKTARLRVPVISVGNITTGGTGKTPTVIMIAKELQLLGRKPAVLTRGYGAPKNGKSDEVMVIEDQCPGVPVIVNANRIVGGQEAIDKHGADVLIMDDGFQHRRLERDLNIVLVDATEPLGIPGVIPRGTWREPPQNLRRASAIMLTRCEQVTPELAELAGNLLTQWVPARDIYPQRTVITGVFDSQGNPVSPEPGLPVMALAGIGNPQGFLHTVRSLGVHVATGVWFDDHHQYELPGDFAALERLTTERGIKAWITTQKDFVKIREHRASVPIWHVRIETRLVGRAGEVFRRRLADIVSGQ